MRDTNFPRAAVATRVGLHAGFGFPIRIGGEVEGVIEFFSRDIEQPDEPLLEVVGTLGVQLGQFLERRRAEESLERSQRDLAGRVAELAESDRRKDEFLAMLAHELRNPLAPIAAAAEILGDVESAIPASRVRATILDRQVQHMVQLIDDLLDVSRITPRARSSSSEQTWISPTVVEYALEVSQRSIEARNHTLELALPDEPVVLRADLMRLAQALGNLLNNAAKFTDARRPDPAHAPSCAASERVDPRARQRHRHRARAPAAGLRAVRPVRATPDRSHGGLGIGLTLVRTPGRDARRPGERARARGRAAAASSPCALPARRGEPRARPPSAPAPSVARARAAHPAGGGQQGLRRRARAPAPRRGHEVHVARDGSEGLEQARELRPDVVLLDIGLPGLDGYEVARRLREDRDPKRPLLVAVSGTASRKIAGARARPASITTS